MTMTTPRSGSRPSSRLAAVVFVLAATLFFSLLPSLTAQAWYTEGSQLPGTVQKSNNRGGGTSTGGHRCGAFDDPMKPGPVLWRLEANGRWRVEIINYPRCAGNMTVVVDANTNQLATVWIEDNPWGNAGNHMYCVKYLEVLRFYGPQNDPARYVTRSIAEPAVPCAETDGFHASLSRFGLIAPHPHDAHRNVNSPLYRSTGTYATTKPLSEAWQPQATIGTTGTHCPLPDDPANLGRFFTTDWPTEEEALLARGFRQGMSTALATLLQRVRGAGLPDVAAYSVLNASGTKTFSGDGFATLNYSDGIPCSSPLDFTVPKGQDPWVYGVCAAPVVTAYRGPFWVRPDGTTYWGVVEAYPDAWDTSPTRNGYRRHLPDYQIETARNYFGSNAVTNPNDPVLRAYRQKAAGILGRTDQFQYRYTPNVVGRAAEMAANLPCAYGQGPVEPDQVVVQQREPVDPIAIIGPESALAYVGGVRTAQTFTFAPNPVLTCNGGQPCTQGQVIRSVSYSPEIQVPAGWTACGANNRGTCDYKVSTSTQGNTLRVYLETYTATRPGEAIRINPAGHRHRRVPATSDRRR